MVSGGKGFEAGEGQHEDGMFFLDGMNEGELLTRMKEAASRIEEENAVVLGCLKRLNK